MTTSFADGDQMLSSNSEASASRRVAVVVASVHHGNTLRVAQAIATPLDADLLTPDECTPDRLADYSLIGVGSGIYFGRHHRTVRTLVRSLDHATGAVFIFSTAGLPFLARLFHWPLRRSLIRRGRNVIGEFSCRGWDTVGPLFLIGGLNRRHPNERDLERAASFGNEMAMRVASFRAAKGVPKN